MCRLLHLNEVCKTSLTYCRCIVRRQPIHAHAVPRRDISSEQALRPSSVTSLRQRRQQKPRVSTPFAQRFDPEPPFTLLTAMTTAPLWHHVNLVNSTTLLHTQNSTLVKPLKGMRWHLQVHASAASAAGDPAEAVQTPPKPWPGIKLVPLLGSVAVGLALRFLVPVPTGLSTQAWTLLSIFVSTIAGVTVPPGAAACTGFSAHNNDYPDC